MCTIHGTECHGGPLRCRRRNACLATLVAVVLAQAVRAAVEPPDRPGRVIAQVWFPSLGAMDEFLAARPEIRVRSERRVPRPELLLTPRSLAEIQALGYPYHAVADLDSSSLEAPPIHSKQKTTLYSFQEHIDTLQALAGRYPTLTSLQLLGQSTAGLPIYAIKVSDQPELDEDEPTVLFVGVHHADEAVGVDVTLRFLRHYLESYGVNPQITSQIDGSEIWVVPLANPDGWMKLEDGTLSAWRKNTRDNNEDQMFDADSDGVDLNRNYDFNWNHGNPSMTLGQYRGPYPFSEPEIVLLRDLILATRPSLALSYHQSGEMVIIPWTWNGMATPEYPVYRQIAQELASSIPKLGGAPYDWFEEDDVAGYMEDWTYAIAGGFALCIEVTTPGRSDIPEAVENNLNGCVYAMGRLFGPQVTGTVTNQATGLPVQAEIGILGLDASVLIPRTSDPATGRYRWILNPGSYTLTVNAPGYVGQNVPVTVGSSGPTMADIPLTLSALAVEPEAPGPALTSLAAWPNPTRTGSLMRFHAADLGPARLEILDTAGRRVRALFHDRVERGWSQIAWDGRDDAGRPVPTGLYLCRFSQGRAHDTFRLVVTR